MAKVTVETTGLIATKEDIDRAYKAAMGAYLLLRGMDYSYRMMMLEMVEIIKATVCTQELGKESVSFATFQIVCKLPPQLSLSKKERLKVIAEWESRRNMVAVLKNEPRTGEYIGQIRLQDTHTETLARALIEAIQMGFRHYRSRRLGELAEWLTQREANLESLIRVPAEA